MTFPVLRKSLLAVALVAAANLAWIGTASAHCDAVDGPVITAAAAALQNGDVTPLLKWVPAADEAAIRSAFADARKVRKQGPDARKVADLHFYEALVQVHRVSEGAPFTGIKPAGGIQPAIAAADTALESGNIDPLIAEITGAVEHGIRERFQAARSTRDTADRSTDDGREFVAAYVQYVHYLEKLHDVAAASTAPHTAPESPDAAAGTHAH
ncbi:DUF6448 family protein [Thermomonas fusca]|uniref:DUF6448 family protein n=1 Tax=Thermomonas fusca TaxID=215690 RepID=UPI0003F60DCE|nr:DUF6448 family protein [Thermomonas fusca]